MRGGGVRVRERRRKQCTWGVFWESLGGFRGKDLILSERTEMEI